MKNLIVLVKKHELLGLFCLVYLIYNINGRTISSGDTVPASLLPFSILENHNLYFDQFSYYLESTSLVLFFARGGGNLLSNYPIVTPILITPLYILPFLFMKLAHIPMDMSHPGFLLIVVIMEKLSAALIASLSVIFVFLSVRELINKRTAFIVALIFAFATNTWAISSQALWQHGLVELLLALSIYFVLLNEKKASDKIIVGLGIISGLFIFNRLADSILLIPVIFYILLLRDRRIFYYFSAMALSGVPFLIYNLYYFGNIFGGYGGMAAQIHFNSEAIIGFISMIISPSRGIFIYTPIVLFSLVGFFKVSKIQNKNIKTFLSIFAISILGQILLYGAFICWWAGWSYGPRFLTGMLPILSIFLGLYIKDISFNMSNRKSLLPVICIFSILLIWSVFTQIVGAFYYPNGGWDADLHINADYTISDSTSEKLWDWNDTQIKRSFYAGIAPPRNFLNDIFVIANSPCDILAKGNLGKGWYGIETWDGNSTRWIENDAQIFLYSPENQTANISLRLTSFSRPKTIEIYSGRELEARANIPSTGFRDMVSPIRLVRGINIMRFHIPEGCERPSDKPELNNNDFRCLGMAIQKIALT